MQEKDLAYIAGFIDGEGCIRIGVSKNSRNPSLQVNASNSVIAPLEFIQTLFGGSIYVWEHTNIKWKTSYRWAIYGRQGAIVLKSILPYLIIKKRQALLGIEYVLLSDRMKKARIIYELNVLNKKGN